jgi:hypothetical protein
VRRALPFVAGALALAATAPAALAQAPGDPAATTPSPPPPAPAPAGVSVRLGSGIVDHHKRFVLARDHVVVTGTVKPFVDGQSVDVELFRGKHRVGHRSVKVTKAKNGDGQFKATLKLSKAGSYSVDAHHQGSDQQADATSPRQRIAAIRPRARGHQNIRLIQIGLRRLGYVAPLTGHLEDGTRRALLAFRKVNRMSRNSSPSKSVLGRLFRGSGAFRVRYPKAGRHVEADLKRQVLVLADHGRPVQVYTMSSGKPSTPTVKGAFRFYSKTPGTNAHGMVDSSYFHGGYAVHGYPDVPAAYPASHGCIRVPIPDAARIYGSVSLGEQIFVYA